MITAEARFRLLEIATNLHARREYHALSGLLAEVSDDTLMLEPELGYLLALAQATTGKEKRALDLLQSLAEACTERGNERLARRRANLEGVLLLERGDLDAAKRCFATALASALSANDQEVVAWVTNNIGIIETIRCKWSDAITAHNRALTAFHRLGKPARFAQCHHNLGMVYRQLGYLDKADSHFVHALSYAQQYGSAEELTYTEFERALLICERGDVVVAEITARRALSRARALGNTRLEGEAARVVGIIARESNQLQEARSYLNSALALAAVASSQLLEAEVHEELAVLELRAGNHAASLRFANASMQLYYAMGAPSHAARVYRRLMGGGSEQLAG